MGMKGKRAAPKAAPVAWVVGATSGIGREAARAFASVGCAVAVSGRRTALLGKVCREIVSRGGNAMSVPCDVSDAADVRRAAAAVRRMAGPVDILVNSAGITVFKSFSGTSVREFSDIVSTNLLGPVLCLKAVLPDMLRRRRGWVFNVLSTAAVRTFEGSAAYTATKAGMLGLGRVVREELRNSGVRVVNVMPGATETAMWSRGDRRRFGRKMMSPRSVAEALLSVYLMPEDALVEELVLRPVTGDIP